MKLLIIGGGASGLMAAIVAARRGALVTIIEHQERIGRKLLSTGNGRCNYTNLRMEPDCFRGASTEFIFGIINQFGVEETLNFFEELGIMPKEKHGYIYPYSEQAAAILDALRFETEHLGVRIRLGETVTDIVCGDHFQVQTDHGSYEADRLILSCGGRAAPITGSDGSGYVLAKAFGHSLVPVVPALVQLFAQDSIFPSVGGVRCDAKVTIESDGLQLAEDRGELQLTDYGISGIPVFQVSRYAANALADKQSVKAIINFLPDFSEKRLFYYFLQRAVKQSWKNMEQFLTGIFPKKLAVALIKKAGLSVASPVESCTASTWKRLTEVVLHLELPITGTKGFESAQVCAGGVDTAQISPDSLESKLQKHLYLTGELLDVDGICGGYNLQWAWSSGYVAAMHATEE